MPNQFSNENLLRFLTELSVERAQDSSPSSRYKIFILRNKYTMALILALQVQHASEALAGDKVLKFFPTRND